MDIFLAILNYFSGDNLSQHNIQSQKQSLTIQIQSNCDKAKYCFVELMQYPGIWDIFVTKYAEVFSYFIYLLNFLVKLITVIFYITSVNPL